MEALAEPGKAYLTEHAAELAPASSSCEDLGEFEIKGASQPVRVFELAGVGAARSRLDLSRERGFSRFVGRDEEMAVLEEALERARERRGRRDRDRRRARRRQEPALPRVRRSAAERRDRGLRGPGPGARHAIPFMPVLQMLRAYFGIADARAGADRAREDRRPRAAARPRFAEDLPLLFDFLGVPDPDRPAPQLSAEARQRALRGIVCRLVNAPSRRKTLVAA